MQVLGDGVSVGVEFFCGEQVMQLKDVCDSVGGEGVWVGLWLLGMCLECCVVFVMLVG